LVKYKSFKFEVCNKLGKRREGKKKTMLAGGTRASREQETMMTNLAPRQINLRPKLTNMTPRQTAVLCNMVPSALTVHTIPENF